MSNLIPYIPGAVAVIGTSALALLGTKYCASKTQQSIAQQQPGIWKTVQESLRTLGNSSLTSKSFVGLATVIGGASVIGASSPWVPALVAAGTFLGLTSSGLIKEAAPQPVQPQGPQAVALPAHLAKPQPVQPQGPQAVALPAHLANIANTQAGPGNAAWLAGPPPAMVAWRRAGGAGFDNASTRVDNYDPVNSVGNPTGMDPVRNPEREATVAAIMQMIHPVMVDDDNIRSRIGEEMVETKLFHGQSDPDVPVLEQIRNGYRDVIRDQTNPLHRFPEDCLEGNAAETDRIRVAAHELMTDLRNPGNLNNADLLRIRDNLIILLDEEGTPFTDSAGNAYAGAATHYPKNIERFLGQEQIKNIRKLIGLIDLYTVARQPRVQEADRAMKYLLGRKEEKDHKMTDVIRLLNIIAPGQVQEAHLGIRDMETTKKYIIGAADTSGSVADLGETKTRRNEVELLGFVMQREGSTMPEAVVRRKRTSGMFDRWQKNARWIKLDHSRQGGAQRSDVNFSEIAKEADRSSILFARLYRQKSR